MQSGEVLKCWVVGWTWSLSLGPVTSSSALQDYDDHWESLSLGIQVIWGRAGAVVSAETRRRSWVLVVVTSLCWVQYSLTPVSLSIHLGNAAPTIRRDESCMQSWRYRRNYALVLLVLLAPLPAQRGNCWKPQLNVSNQNSQSLVYTSEQGVISIPVLFPIVAVRLQSHAAGEASSQEISSCFKPSAIHEPHFWNEPTKPSQQHSVNETPTIDSPPGTRLFRCYCACCATKQGPQRKNDAIRCCQIWIPLLSLWFIHWCFSGLNRRRSNSVLNISSNRIHF